MTDTSVENQLLLTNTKLRRQITLLEEMLLEKEKAWEVLQDSEKYYRRIFESTRDGILILNADTGKVVDINPRLVELLGDAFDEFCGKYIWELGAFKDIDASKEAFKTLQDNEYIRYENLPLKTHDGRTIPVEFVSIVYLVDHKKLIQCNIRDVTAHKQVKAKLKRLLEAFEQIEETIVITDAQGNIQFVNSAFERTTGYSQEEAVGQNSRIFKSGVQDELFYRTLWDTISGGKTWTGRIVNKRKDGVLYTEEVTISPVRADSGQIVNYVAVKRNITEQLRLAAQFQQAQKMEAVGLLAGGVAHDFNNMLSVILGYTEMALHKIDPTEPLHADLVEIFEAAKRSAEITQQLLAFARKQTINPVVLDLNHTVESLLKMLRRLIGEDINLIWLPKNDQCLVKVDPVQFGQILANLCVNARSAITDVGKVIIEMENIAFDETYCAHHAGFVAGEYVVLTVSDDGCGMDKETINQIFEPFFTTKLLGQGTGLGLSTVYGIVKQNYGYINVYSETGKGTTFRIYLPRYASQAVDIQKKIATETPLSCGETVLVVEDEIVLLTMTKIMLETLGYRVLTVGTPDEAIRLAEEHTNEIQLLITDVVMPNMNGRDLAKQLQSIYPSMKILFMSGYTANVIAHRGVLDEDVNFIPKPFSMKDLAVKVRDAMQKR